MGTRSTLKVAFGLTALLSLVLGVAEVQSRQQRQPSRRVTTPVQPRPTPASDEPRVVSTADDPQDETPREARARRNRAAAQQQQQQRQREEDESRRVLEELSAELTRLNKKVDEMEKQRRVDLIMERLTRAEQRAEAVQTQLRDTQEKEANLQARVEQLDDALRPESLNRQLATIGTFRPDEERDRLRRQYENEKARVQGLLEVNGKQRQRLEASLQSADQLVQRLRAQLDEETRREVESDAAAAGEGGPRPFIPPTPTPTPTPPPPR
jgi:chromosome segregation ATPase